MKSIVERKVEEWTQKTKKNILRLNEKERRCHIVQEGIANTRRRPPNLENNLLTKPTLINTE